MTTARNEFTKAQFDIKGNHLELSVPFEKNSINESKREVSGFATLDNLDSQGDIVLKEASASAFSRARGNIREMHQPKAVGKLRHFEEKTLFDDDGTPYTGIYVTVHVSKGAQDTWEKVLDGTLSGFSIGGNITDSDTQWVKDNHRNVRFVKSYDLIELSLVDNPANQLANVFSFTKAADGSTVLKGMVAEIAAENVFYCNNDHSGITELTSDSDAECVKCHSEMKNIGTFNTGEETSNEKVAEIVTKFLENEGGVTDMTDTTDTSAESTETSTESHEDVAPLEEVEAPVNQPEAGEEVEAHSDEAKTEEAPVEEKVEEVDETEENDITKVIDSLKAAVQKSVEDSREIAEEASRKVEESFTKASETFTEKALEIDSKYDELSKKLDALKSEADETRKSLEVALGGTAFKKSGEVESPEVTTKKSGIFGGVFLSADGE